MLPIEAVQLLFVSGFSTQQIAAEAGVTRRRVQQIVADLQPRANEVTPTESELDAMVTKLRWQLGEYYGTCMMEGALRAEYPGYCFHRRRVRDSLSRLFPAEMIQRKYVQQWLEPSNDMRCLSIGP